MIAKLLPLLLCSLFLFFACVGSEPQQDDLKSKASSAENSGQIKTPKEKKTDPSNSTAKAIASANAKPDWKEFEEGETLAKSSKKNVLVYVYDPDCSNCAEMEAGTFSHPVILNLLKEHFVAIKLNGRSRENITARGRTFKAREIPGTEPFHELAMALTKAKDALELPAVVFMDKDLNMIEVLKGTISERRMEVLLKYIGENHWPEVDAKIYADTLTKEIQ